MLLQLEREAALMQRCAHENVCKLFESQVDVDGVCGLVLELLDKGSLEQAMDAAPDKRIREFEVTRLSLHILAALVFMHSQGVIHRDIKPANICLTEVDGQRLYKLIDLSGNLIEFPILLIACLEYACFFLCDLYHFGICGWFLIGFCLISA